MRSHPSAPKHVQPIVFATIQSHVANLEPREDADNTHPEPHEDPGQTRSKMAFLNGYLFLSHGPRHVSDVRLTRAAQHQMHALQTAADHNDLALRIVGWDYARRLRGPEDLKQLFLLLEQIKNSAASRVIFIDDYSRLFRVADKDAKSKLWSALLEHAHLLGDLRQSTPLTQVNPVMAAQIRNGTLPRLSLPPRPNTRTKQDRIKQTAKARAVSRRAREAATRKAARALCDALLEQRAKDPHLTIKDFLATETAQALRNAQGRPWRYRTALRAIRRMEDGGEPQGDVSPGDTTM